MERQHNTIEYKIILAIEKLFQIQRILLWDIVKKEGISPIQIQFILHIRKYPEELCSVSNIAMEFDLSKATVSDSIASLLDKRLLKKIPNSVDKRSYGLRLTAKGEKTAGRVSTWQDALFRQIKKFDQGKKEVIMLFFMELIKNLYDEGVINIARMCIACENLGSEDDSEYFCKLTGQSLLSRDYNIGCKNFKKLA